MIKKILHCKTATILPKKFIEKKEKQPKKAVYYTFVQSRSHKKNKAKKFFILV